MTQIRNRRRTKPDPLAAPIADEATAMPASDRVVTSSDNLPRLSRDAVAELEDQLAQRQAGDVTLLQRAEALVDAAGRAKADNEEQSGRCADLVRQLGAVVKVIEDVRKGVKEPYLEAGRAVDDRAKGLKAPLEKADADVRLLMLTFARKEQARRRKEEEDRQREEDKRLREEEEKRKAAEAKGEPAPEPIYESVAEVYVPAKAPIIRGDYGATASATKVFVGNVKDWRKAFRAVEGNQAVRDAVQKAINARIKAGDREIPGVEITEDVGLRVR